MFFHSKINSIPRKLDDKQLSSVTCPELKPLLRVCQLFGLVPFSLKSYRSSSRHYLVMAVMASIVNLSIVMVIAFGPFRQMRKPMESLLFTIVHYIIMFIQLTCMSNVYIRCITQKGNLISILRRIQTSIFHLKTLGIVRKREARHVRLLVLTYVILFYVTQAITVVNYPRLFKTNYFAGFLLTFSNALTSTITFYVELEYIILFYVIYRKFRLINETFRGSRNFAHYKQIVIIHNRLCDLCYDINSVFE